MILYTGENRCSLFFMSPGQNSSQPPKKLEIPNGGTLAFQLCDY